MTQPPTRVTRYGQWVTSSSGDCQQWQCVEGGSSMTSSTDNYRSSSGNAIWEGFEFRKVYRDEDGRWFDGGGAQYAVYRYSKLLGYCPLTKKPDTYYLECLAKP